MSEPKDESFGWRECIVCIVLFFFACAVAGLGVRIFRMWAGL